ncbi:MAG: type II secretion system F family protein [Thermoguttaceae bacterium]
MDSRRVRGNDETIRNRKTPVPAFRYTARQATGEKIEGSLDAASEQEAVSQLVARGLFPLAVHQPVAVRHRGRRISGSLLSSFYSQLADLLRGGVPILRALKIIEEQTSHPQFRLILEEVSRRVEEGETLAEAFGRFEMTFGTMGVQMIRAGSEGGFLEESLRHVADFTEAQNDLRGRIAGALAYPIILTAFMSTVVVVILGWLVPYFEPLFADLRRVGELPMITEIVLAAGKWTKVALPFAIPAAIALFFYARYWSSTTSGRQIIDSAKLHLPVAGKVYAGFSVARFCRVLGTLLRNGVPIVKSLDIAADAIGNVILADAVHTASEKIAAGERLAPPLAASGRFPKTVTEMIAVAEESNSLDTVLVEIATSLEKRNWRALDLAVRLLEPIMLLVLGGVVLFLVLSLMVPIFKMANV